MRRDLNRVTSQSKTKRRLINGGGELCARDGSKQASLGIGPLWVEMDDCEFDPDPDLVGSLLRKPILTVELCLMVEMTPH